MYKDVGINFISYLLTYILLIYKRVEESPSYLPILNKEEFSLDRYEGDSPFAIKYNLLGGNTCLKKLHYQLLQ